MNSISTPSYIGKFFNCQRPIKINNRIFVIGDQVQVVGFNVNEFTQEELSINYEGKSFKIGRLTFESNFISMNNGVKKNWKSFPKREDLFYIPDMMELGFVPIFHHQDKLAQRTTPDDIPMYSVGFQIGELNLWQIREGWQIADLIAVENTIYYKNHRPTKETLPEILARFRKDGKL